MTNVEDVKQFQLEIASMIRKLHGISNSMQAQSYELDNILSIHEAANNPDQGEVIVDVSGTSLKVDAVVIADSAINQMYEIHSKVNPLLIRLQEAIDGQG